MHSTRAQRANVTGESAPPMIRAHLRVWLPAWILAAVGLLAAGLSVLFALAAAYLGSITAFLAVFMLLLALASGCALPWVIVILVPIARKARRLAAGRCSRCNYILHGADRCPECGTKAPR